MEERCKINNQQSTTYTLQYTLAISVLYTGTVFGVSVIYKVFDVSLLCIEFKWKCVGCLYGLWLVLLMMNLQVGYWCSDP